MKNDVKIQKKVKEIQGLMDTWAFASSSSQDSYTDAILEEIISRSRELQDLHNNKYDLQEDIEDMVQII